MSVECLLGDQKKRLADIIQTNHSMLTCTVVAMLFIVRRMSKVD